MDLQVPHLNSRGGGAYLDEHLADPRLPEKLRPRLRQAGFAVGIPEAFATTNDACAEYSNGFASLVAALAHGQRGVTRNAADAWLAGLLHLDEEGVYFFSINNTFSQPSNVRCQEPPDSTRSNAGRRSARRSEV
jgi:hypothetical protein